MSEPFIGEIRMFAGNYAPRLWAYCDGQRLSIAQNDALYSVLGTAYGGDGRSMFNLPDLRGRLPMHQGRAPWGTTRALGEAPGHESVMLTAGEMPSHTHGLMGTSDGADSKEPGGRLFADSGAVESYSSSADAPVQLGDGFLGDTGAGQPHENRMPALSVNFIIALQGLYPTRN